MALLWKSLLLLPFLFICAFTNPKPDFETSYRGVWKLDHPNVGVSAMQLQLMPSGKVVWFDTTNLGPSAVQFDPPFCRPIPNDPLHEDCFAHALEYDPQTSQVRLLKFWTDPWCSSGGLAANGDLVSTGGNLDGNRTVRILSMLENSEFEEKTEALAAARWYSGNAILEDGSFILVGGRTSFSYEIIPPFTLSFEPKLFDLPLLKETTDEKENNLYPFVYLLPDGNVYIFSNYKSIILKPHSGETIRSLPDLPGGGRNYPSSAMSALLPLNLCGDGLENVEAEVIICGGNTRDAAKYSEFPPRTFTPALKDCNRMVVTSENPEWDREDMPSRRVMGDLLILPNGELLMLNGAKAGTAAWEAAIQPNLTPVLYSPNKPKGQRFRELHATTIPRMYHSTSAVLPNGQILVAGSNPNQFYNFTAEFPTELRVEKFTPPYLAHKLKKHRPIIIEQDSDTEFRYGDTIKVCFNLNAEVDVSDIKVTMYPPPFTTHGFSQSQRLLILAVKRVFFNQIRAMAPPSSALAPPGYYILSVVHRGVPSEGIWVHIQF